MDACPPEIHDRIFYFACLNDAKTGVALSSVSHYVREVSSPHQWLSLSLLDYRRTMLFSHCLFRFVSGPPRRRRPIYHLFITDDPGLDEEASYARICSQRELSLCLSPIVQYAAPTLKTLTFYSSSTFRFMGSEPHLTLLFGVHYPNLVELTLRARCTPVQLTSFLKHSPLRPLFTSTEEPATMANLERLHLAMEFRGLGYGNLEEIHKVIRYLTSSSHSPSRLTHLRISMLDLWPSVRAAEVVHAELAHSGLVSPVLDLPPYSPTGVQDLAIAPDITWPRLLSPTLKQFVLQPSPTVNFYCSCCMDSRGDIEVMRLFEKIAREAERNDKDAFLYLGQRGLCSSFHSATSSGFAPSMSLGYGREEALLDWRERIEDKKGCWQQRLPKHLIGERQKKSVPPRVGLLGSSTNIVSSRESSTAPIPDEAPRRSKFRLFSSKTLDKVLGSLRKLSFHSNAG
ncbi:hypothetical protein K474DRAFT_1656318 [Panus rudis PR-1116 ss-1]|nr:hypothetical protein K474DRAFT_1656318 [Panus rudis PR-1116 ss-1]